MEHKSNYNDLREAIKRAEQKRKPATVPDDFVDSVLSQIEAETQPRPKTVKLWRWVAAAACIAILLGVGTVLFLNQKPAPQPTIVAISDTSVTIPTEPSQPQVAETEIVPESEPIPEPNPNPTPKPPVKKPSPKPQPQPQPVVENVPRQADRKPSASPVKMDELISSLAQMQGAEKKEFDCETDEAVYVFEDNDDLNLFGRLILAASNYPNDTEGYFLNYSAEKFFFCIDDETSGDGYLWTAEKTDNGKIMLYCSHSPNGIADESDCYKNFARKITYGNMNTITNL